VKIFQVHNYYQQAGGEDAVVAAERAMLEEHGNIVVPFYKSNDAISGCGELDDEGGISCLKSKVYGLGSLFFTALKTIWNWETYREFRKLLQAEKPDVVHCHNTFPLISPSIYWACAKEGVPVVQTLHNYRLLCLNAFLFRITKKKQSAKSMEHRGELVADPNLKPIVQNLTPCEAGAVCELCVHRSFKWPGIRYACYRGSRAGSLVVALMLFVHKMMGTRTKKITVYITLTEFQKQKMVEGGLPKEKIWVKPNFLQRSDVGSQASENTEQKPKEESPTSDVSPSCGSFRAGSRSLTSGQQCYALFVGRLSPEKGCDVLIRAWSLFEQKLTFDAPPLISGYQKPQLFIVGDGPEREALENLAAHLKPKADSLKPQNIHFLGKKPKNKVLQLMRHAQFLVLPSVWYEGFPMTIVEAFSSGLPVVASDIGSMTSVIEDEQNGLLFSSGDCSDLAEKITWSFGHPEELRKMGRQARQAFETNYSAEENFDLLCAIYNEVMERGR
jgi:glycosyltransferase involved in cell wall biosynthesis